MSGLARTGELLSCCTTRKYLKKRTLFPAGCAGAFAPDNWIGRSGIPQGDSLRSLAALRQPDRTTPIQLPSAQRARRDTGQRCCPPLLNPLPGERETTTLAYRSVCFASPSGSPNAG